MTDVMLGQNQLRPQLLDYPVTEIVVLVQIDLLSHFLLTKTAIDLCQFFLDLIGLIFKLFQ